MNIDYLSVDPGYSSKETNYTKLSLSTSVAEILAFTVKLQISPHKAVFYTVLTPA